MVSTKPMCTNVQHGIWMGKGSSDEGQIGCLLNVTEILPGHWRTGDDISDDAKEELLGEWKKTTSQHGTRNVSSEPHSSWSNLAEQAIKEAKRAAGRKQVQAKSPRKLWDHCIELECEVRHGTALGYPELEGQVPHTIMTGQTTDISPYVEHAWYDWVKAIDPTIRYPHDCEILRRCLGPAPSVGPEMCAKILKSNRCIMYSSTYCELTAKEWRSPDEARA